MQLQQCHWDSNRHLALMTVELVMLLYKTISHMVCLFASNVGLKDHILIYTLYFHTSLGTCNNITTTYLFAVFYDKILLWLLVFERIHVHHR